MKYYVAHIADNAGRFPAYALISKSGAGLEFQVSDVTLKGLAEIIAGSKEKISIGRRFFEPPQGESVSYLGGLGKIRKLDLSEIAEFQKSLQM